MRVTPTCDTINSLFVSDAMGIQRNPDIVFGASVHFVVWADERSGSPFIFGARVTPTGTVLDPIGIAISEESGESPVVDYDGSRFFVVWTTTSAIKGAFCSTDGAPQQYITINTTGTSMYGPNIAFDGSNYLVAWIQWTGSEYEILGQRVSQSGSLLGPCFTIGSTNIAVKPGLCFDGTYYCVAWTESYDIWGCLYTTSGIPVGSPFLVSDHPDIQIFCDIAAGTNKYLFTWGQIISSDYDVYGNVDIAIGVSEIKQPDVIYYTMPTILRGPLPVLKGENYRVYDITGQEIKTTNPAPGVYFIIRNSIFIQEVIKIK